MSTSTSIPADLLAMLIKCQALDEGRLHDLNREVEYIKEVLEERLPKNERESYNEDLRITLRDIRLIEMQMEARAKRIGDKS
jgi:hypothetical protein